MAPANSAFGNGFEDFYLAAPKSNGGTLAGQAYVVFGRQGGFPAELDLTSLDGTNGYVMDGLFPQDYAGVSGGAAGDLNHDGIADIAMMASGRSSSDTYLRGGRTFVLYGGIANLAALDVADGLADGRIQLSTLDAPTADGAHGFVVNGEDLGLPWSSGVGFYSQPHAAGDVNGDQVDDLFVFSTSSPYAAYVVFGRDSTAGHLFPATFELASLQPANGGDGSAGFVIFNNGGQSWGCSSSAGDINGDGIRDIAIAAPNDAFVIFGQRSFPATFDTGSLNGANGFTIHGPDGVGFGAHLLGLAGAGDLNADGVDDLAIGAALLDGPAGADVGGGYVLFGKSASGGGFPAVFDIATLNGSNGFVIYGATAGANTGQPQAAGDVNGDGYDDLILTASLASPGGVHYAGQTFLVYGRPAFGQSLELSNLLAANGGDGSRGYVLNGFLASPSASLRAVGVGDVNGDGFDELRLASHLADSEGLTDSGLAYIVYGHPSPPPTRFYVVNDGALDRTYEYYADGASSESYVMGSGNTAPRGAASTIAGEKVWVVDANRRVYVYNAGGGLIGSWTAGTLASNATVEGIATNGTDIWIVDAKSDKVFKYAGAATRTSGSQNASGTFNLNSGNTSPKDIVTDGTSLWVVNDSTTDKVFKYTVAGSLRGSWTISSGGGSPTGITLDPSNVSHLWIVDSATDRVYRFDGAAGRTSGAQSPSASFALAAGNTNPQGIADPPVPGAGLARAPRSLDQRDVSPTASTAVWDAEHTAQASQGASARYRLADQHCAVPNSHQVDELLRRSVSEWGCADSAASVARTTVASTRRVPPRGSDVSFELRAHLDAKIESVVDDLLATGQPETKPE
jgi:hypothetical protein